METLLFVLKSLLLGIVEGITEFLPVSSTGHLVIFQNLIGFEGNNHYVEMYTYVIQLGAILAVIILYRRKITDTLVNFFPGKTGYDRSGFKFWFMIFIACIPGGIIGILLDDIAEAYLFSPIPVAITLFFGGILMIYAEKRFRIITSEAGRI
jgi:undecaprenyl-diphosphatase